MGMPVSNGPAVKRIRWKAGKEDELWAYMQEQLSAGANTSDALKTFADRNGISWLTARWKYYRLKQDRTGKRGAARAKSRKTRRAPAPVAAGSPDTVPVEALPAGEGPAQDQTIQVLSDFLRSASRLDDTDLAAFLRGLATMARMALEGQKAKALEQRLRDYESWTVRARRQYESLGRVINEWLSAPGVERIASIQDFDNNLKAEVEALGREFNAVAAAGTAQPGQAGQDNEAAS